MYHIGELEENRHVLIIATPQIYGLVESSITSASAITSIQDLQAVNP
jgi:hypothetical protein